MRRFTNGDMKRRAIIFAISVIPLFAAPAEAEILGGVLTKDMVSRTPPQTLIATVDDGQRRVCYYRVSKNDEGVASYVIGMFDMCPSRIPFVDPNQPAPPSASLSDSSIRNGMRACTYVQGAGRWTFNLPLSSYCPLAAGMAAQTAKAAKLKK